jgi:CDP-diacylglycerol pyrophosphatase
MMTARPEPLVPFHFPTRLRPQGPPPGSPAVIAAVLVRAVVPTVVLTIVLTASLSACGQPQPGHGGSLALWRIVNAGCNGGQVPGPGMPGLVCGASGADAVLKDIDPCKPTHYLLIPTARRIGVESPELVRASEPDYFADAWEARRYTLGAAGLAAAASDEIGLALNSRWARSQDQLHIHIDLVRPEVTQAVRRWAGAGQVSGQIGLAGHEYRIEHIASLKAPTPFQRLADASGSPLPDRLTIAVIGDGGNGFLLLSDLADPAAGDRGHAEDLLAGHSCIR